MLNLPVGFRCCKTCLPAWTVRRGRVFIFIATFLIYTSYHLSRKPISVVKAVLHPNCTEEAAKEGKIIVPENATYCCWKPFDGDNYSYLMGTLDLVYLGAYAVSMFISGHIADWFHLRTYLAIGCLLSGITTAAFGLGYFFDIHSYAFYVVIQLVAGFAQSTGWPAVIACLVNWFGKSHRGLFMGVWTGHTSLGNVLGSVIAGAFVPVWGWSFVVPGLIIGVCGVLTWLFLIPYPEELDLPPPEREGVQAGTVYAVHGDSSTSLMPDEHADDEIDLFPPVQSNSQDRAALGSIEEEEEQTNPDERVGSLEKLNSSGNAAYKPVSFCDALRVPGVMEYSLCLFFAKLVAYTFLFWLPDYIQDAGHFSPSSAADLSAIFDMGGLLGGILAGYLSDLTGTSAVVCVMMLALGVPVMFAYYALGTLSTASCIGWLIPLGVLVNGPYALITTAVSADLGTHPSLQANTRALATVSGIIDGTGSLGAMLGPLLCGFLMRYSWLAVFVMLMICLALAILLLSRRVHAELRLVLERRRAAQLNRSVEDLDHPVV